jgi:hypothetical protein
MGSEAIMSDTQTNDECCSFSVHIPKSLIRRIRARAAMEDRDVADLTAAAVKSYLDAHEVKEGRGNEIIGI